MNIRPISIQYCKTNTIRLKSNSISNPIYSNKNDLSKLKYPISFCGLISNSDLKKNGYKVAKIENNKLLSNDDCIIITSAEQFLTLQNSPNVWNKKIVLSNNIDLNGAQIKPIGNSNKPFSGEFDGNGCVIKNFKVVPDNSSYNIGLFGKCQDAKISNLDIQSAYISGGQQIGGIAGWAKNSIFNNCFFQGYIKGEKNIGGLIGISKNNKIENCGTQCNIESVSKNKYNRFSFERNTDTLGIVGGLIGSDDSSEINNSYSKSTLKAKEQVGGFAGYGNKTKIQNASFDGNVTGCEKVGSMIGWAEETDISHSYSLSEIENLFGLDINNTTYNVYSSLDNLMSSSEHSWNSSLWHKSCDKIPRLRIQEKRMSAKELFLDDINNDINIGRIKRENIKNEFSDVYKFQILPPKHFKENDEILKEIRNTKDKDSLFQLFGQIVLSIKDEKYCNNETGKHDELLLELIKNPNMDLNRRFDEFGYNIWCTPLFILTCLNQAYVLQEALKRDDIDPNIGSGFSKNQFALNQAIEHSIDSCLYAFLKEPKMAQYIKPKLNEFKSMKLSPFAKMLFDTYPKIPEYNTSKGGIELKSTIDIPSELIEPLKNVSSLEDVQKITEIDVDYCDSNGNNIANVAATLPKDESLESLKTIIAADKNGTDMRHWNNKSESPFGHALYKGNYHVVGYLLPKVSDSYIRIDDGTDAMLLFSRMPEENIGLNYMENARKIGFSVNSQDNSGTTPLINATNLKHHNTLKYLLSHGANPNMCDIYRQTSLHKACINNDEDAIELLLNSYAYPDIVDDAGFKPIDYLDGKLQEKFKEKFENLTYFYKIAQCDDIADMDTSIHITDDCDESPYDETRKIWKDLSSNKLHEAILDLSRIVVLNDPINWIGDFIGDPYTSASAIGGNILHLISEAKSPYAKECIKLAIDKGYDINQQNEYGETPLIKALDAYLCASTTEEKIILMQNIKALLDADPNVDMVDNNKQGALHRVCQSGNPLLLMEILRLNPKINQVDSQGCTPFDYIPEDTDNPMRQITNKYLEEHSVTRKKQ